MPTHFKTGAHVKRKGKYPTQGITGHITHELSDDWYTIAWDHSHLSADSIKRLADAHAYHETTDQYWDEIELVSNVNSDTVSRRIIVSSEWWSALKEQVPNVAAFIRAAVDEKIERDGLTPLPEKPVRNGVRRFAEKTKV